MRYTLLILFSLCLLGLSAQGAEPAGESPDLVVLRDGSRHVGNVSGYIRGKGVVLVKPSGREVTFSDRRVRRIDLDGGAPEPLDTVKRGFRHQIRLPIGFVPNSFDGRDASSLAVAAEYHLLRPVRRFLVGFGAGFELLSDLRGERMASLTGLAEYQIGRRRVRPLIRLSAGLGLPVGSGRLPMYDRSLSPIVHPAIGLILRPPSGEWGALIADLGYRFSGARYSTGTWGGGLNRNFTYRRLTASLAVRF